MKIPDLPASSIAYETMELKSNKNRVAGLRQKNLKPIE